AEQMHYNGFTGTDILICVMDDGFKNVHQIDGFKHLYDNKKIISTKNFLTNDDDIYFVGGHGTAVLSNIAGYIPGKLHGTGYGSSFLLARTEIDSIESPIEMFQWARAAEWADSIGADIISTSLGYTQFDDPTNDFYYADMDGKTTLISQAAAIAVSKGMLVVNSAGNEGGNSWHYISAPADVEGVVTVGAVDANENIANFSSRGPTWDGRTKPDLCCQGVSNVSLSTDGAIYYPSGTSFSCPTFSGFAACMMQLMKNTPVEQIKQMIYTYCSRSASPNSDYGRGIPRAKEIYKHYTGKDLQPLSSCDNLNKEGIYIYPIPAADDLYIMLDNRKNLDHIYVQLIDVTGKTIQNYTFNTQPGLQQIAISPTNENIANGMYYIFLYDSNGNVLTEQKIIFL
ncbi:MAG: S8 family serine peptidase, partial [Bacteroidetes bacterium]|nr:S8 family serine peptidase [Bacteroidota bacterium]